VIEKAKRGWFVGLDENEKLVSVALYGPEIRVTETQARAEARKGNRYVRKVTPAQLTNYMKKAGWV